MTGTWQRRSAAIWLTLATACAGSASSTTVPTTPEDVSEPLDAVAKDVVDATAPSDTLEPDVSKDSAEPDDAAENDVPPGEVFDEDAGLGADADAPVPEVVTDDVPGSDDATSLPDVPTDDTSSVDAAVADVDPSDTLAEDALPDDALVEDVDPADSQAGDAADVETPLAPITPAACEGAVLRRLADRVVVAGPSGLLDAPFDGTTLTDFGPAFGAPPNPPTAHPSTLGAAELFVSSVDSGGCHLRALTAQGIALASTSLPATDCGSPIEVDGQLVQALNDGDAGRLVWLSATTLATLATVDLPGRVTSPTVRVGARVAVGVGSAVLVVDTSGVALSTATGLPRVRRVLVPSPSLLIAFGGAGADDFGDAFVRLAYTGTALETSDPVALPGPALAEPIALADCDGAIANGGSHWWCPGGLVVAAGSGWLTAYDATTGLARGESAVTTDVTGLAATDDGFVYNGGSHWLGGWDFAVADFTIPGPPVVKSLMTASAIQPQCVSSPLPQEDGTVVFVAAGQLHRVATGSGELGPGWTRAGGDAEGSGSPRGASDPCPGTDVRLYARQLRRPAGWDTFRDAISSPAGDIYVAGGQTAGFGGPNSSPRLWRLGADGEQRWVASLNNGPGDDRPALATAIVGDRLAVVAARVEPNGDPTAALNVVDLAGTVVFDQTLPTLDTGSGVFPRAVFGVVSADATTAVMVGNVPSQSPTHLWTARVDVSGAAAATPLHDVTFPADWPVVFSNALRIGPSIWALGRADVVAGEASATVIAIDPFTGALEWTQRHGAPGIYARALAAVETASGASIIEERVDLTSSKGAVVRVTPVGEVTEVLLLPFTPVGIAMLGDKEVVAGQDGLLVLLDGSAMDTFQPLNLGTSTLFAGRVFVHGRTPILVGSVTFSGGADFVDLGLARLDAYAHASCSAAGRCATADCDDGEPCTIDGCDPTSGACTNTPRPDGVTCRLGGVCATGVCE